MPETYQDTVFCGKCKVKCEGKKCSKCHAVRYCGQTCQKNDWPRHRVNCYPVLVKEIENRGRGLVATKHICAGDLIITDKAVIKVNGNADTWAVREESTKK